MGDSKKKNDPKKDFSSLVSNTVQEYFKPITTAIDALSQKVKSIDKDKIVDDIVGQVKEQIDAFQKSVKTSFEAAPKNSSPSSQSEILVFKAGISWPEANNFMHSFAVMLTPEVRSKFYDEMAAYRTNDDPSIVVEAVVDFIKESLVE